MTIRIGINGFGRIGRNVLRAGWGDPRLEFVHVNDLVDSDMLAYLLHRDTVHGTWGQHIAPTASGLSIDGRPLTISKERNPAKIPWAAAEVDVVLECTGLFTSGPKASAHLEAGARKVIISAPGTDVGGTYVYGVNHERYDASQHIVSNASCTTNCLAPLCKVLHEVVGIERGLVTTVHSYTMDQNLLDAPHPEGNFRRARAAAQNIVPSSTGAAKAIALVLPALAGRLDGMAIRVPTPNVSLVDLVFTAERATTVEEINDALTVAAGGSLAGVLAVTSEPVVSSDLVGNPCSSIVDLPVTKVIGERMVKVLSWYDNEWGFSNRMVDLAKHVGA